MILILECTLHRAIKQHSQNRILLEYNVQCKKLDDVLVTAQQVFIEIRCCCFVKKG